MRDTDCATSGQVCVNTVVLRGARILIMLMGKEIFIKQGEDEQRQSLSLRMRNSHVSFEEANTANVRVVEYCRHCRRSATFFSSLTRNMYIKIYYQ